MTAMETAEFDTELSLFKYDNLEQLPPEYRDFDEAERTRRIEGALDALGDDVVILGHNYQRREIVEHADFVGDSYQLSKEAAAADAEYVVFGGVTFMAESADIITDDDQTVVLPSMEASCPMAGMAEALQVDAAWAELTAATDADVVPVTYMNSYADLKAFCAEHGGLVCTSSNAHRAFEYALDEGDKVLFLPDKHLGENTAHRLGLEEEIAEWDPWDAASADAAAVVDNDVILWDGYCQVHERFSPSHVEQVRADHEDARVVVHPECRREVVEAADVVGSTATIRETVAEADPGETWAIGTEVHLTRHLQRWHPEVNVVPLCGEACMDCNAMRQIDPNYLAWVLEELAAGRERNVVEVAPEEKELARVALDRMLEV
ncbi:quinolinate synthetase [Halorubrum ezzemoulense]|uniref:Quinolinate synthase n=2 Tax=Halorubrum ezzemoulense TaxID=337243 RepID=A0A1X4HAE6_HALEZ|nr:MULTISPECIES: quinolinate synthase NadA [Halorubrum]MDB2264612.1 quinolinate synthase NadA [Halorubrum ezzemoulense]MDB2271642.1 quinolinate synthase NadA [Halorubrum ezzemoulense]OSP09951.1 quinolinate synthetase [Halorubrum ezzemoulense DSM 17463]TKX39285.1 quinolinate synthase NadA [Halorubrum sp. CGM4_25_10-8A]TKX65253.1 quinolinate synthase NadA [Halorubrum sp. GN12_10-3_MGM]